MSGKGNALEEPGEYFALIGENHIGEEESGAVFWGSKFHIVGARDENGERQDWTEYGCEISGKQYLVKKDGSLNETTISNLEDVLGWDGDPAHLHNAEFGEKEVLLVVDFEEYNGKRSLRVKFINDPEWTGGLGAYDEDQLKGFLNNFGQKFKARKAKKK